ncbi:type II toxin-antitoxin system RelE family toxin [Arcobacter vandammei]|uniref:type II toxin-antitoxin system RelE family toxin n=1 Tax=Arcobacter vandammei TaxID=2782243 RepID=UPI0018DF036E|nr:type II toxin-antitoxin system RelE/ParE family toxin [Arcobacter vandammei]
MKISIRKSAIKDLQNISEPYKNKIQKKILELKNYPNVQNIKKLTNFEPSYRYRIADYRVLFDISDDCIIIARVLHRKESYK